MTSTNPFDDVGDNDDSTNIKLGLEPSIPSNKNGGEYPFFEETKDDLAAAGGVSDSNQYHYLGEIPYTRHRFYDNVQWEIPTPANTPSPNVSHLSSISYNSSLSYVSPMMQRKLQAVSSTAGMSLEDLRRTMMVTKFAACTNGGPAACVTLPLPSLQMGGNSGSTRQQNQDSYSAVDIRILTSSGRLLSSISFPPPMPSSSSEITSASNASSRYIPSEIHTIGFTSRWVLLVLMRDGICFSYDLSGKLIIPPFQTIVQSEKYGPVELMEAHIFDGGLAVLSTTMNSALVEIMDEHDDVSYVNERHLASRKISGYESEGKSEGNNSRDFNRHSPYFAIITPLPTASHANIFQVSFCTIAVLSRLHTESRRPEVFLSTKDASVVIIDTVNLKIVDVDCRAQLSAPIITMSFAPNGRFLGCYLKDGTLTVISTAFDTKVLDFDTKDVSSSPPKELKWCGEDSIVVHWKDLGVMMVGPFGDWIRFSYENSSNLFIVPEVDCCRVFTDKCVEILQRVHPDTADLFCIGSIQPPSLLLDASDAFESGSSSADEAARAITRTGLLNEAIGGCAKAALREFDITKQKRLLRAASYGMHFSFRAVDNNDDDNSKDDKGRGSPSAVAMAFVTVAKKLRVLNALRDKKVGLPLTSSEYEGLSSSGIIARLVAIQCPSLATSLCDYLKLDRSIMAFARAARASAVVASSQNLSDSETADAAIAILKEDTSDDVATGGSSRSATRGRYATVALAAFRAGRSGVASRLLKLETSPTDLVPALIAIDNFAEAAKCSIKARDEDLLFLTLSEFEKACLSTTGDLEKGRQRFVQDVVRTFPKEALDLLIHYYRGSTDVKRLRDILIKAQKFSQAGSFVARNAYKMGDKQSMIALLQDASQILALGKDNTLNKACTDEYIELMKDQERLQRTYPGVVPQGCSSVSVTLSSMIIYVANDSSSANSLFREVDVLAKKYRVSDKRLWHLKVQSLAKSEQWRFLHNLAEKKSPIGYKAFAVAAIKGKQPLGEIVRYIEKCPQAETRYDLFCSAKLWKPALQEAAKLDDFRRMEYVKSQM